MVDLWALAAAAPAKKSAAEAVAKEAAAEAAATEAKKAAAEKAEALGSLHQVWGRPQSYRDDPLRFPSSVVGVS